MCLVLCYLVAVIRATNTRLSPSLTRHASAGGRQSWSACEVLLASEFAPEVLQPAVDQATFEAFL